MSVYNTIVAFLKKNWIQLLVLSALTIICYINSLGNDFISDDIPGILKNEHLTDLPYIITHPVTMLRSCSYMLIYYASGLNPMGYRLYNIVFHMGNVYLIYILACLLNYPLFVAFIAAALFAVHPVLVESVTWISGGQYAQGTFFLLLSFICYITADKRRWRYILSLIFFVIGLDTSHVLIVYPLILLLYDGLHKKTIIHKWRLGGYFIILFGGAVWYLINAGIRNAYNTNQITTLGSTQLSYPMQIVYAISAYIELFFWPDKLSLYHSDFRFTLLQIGFKIALVSIFILVIILTFKKNKTIFFWLLFFLITLLPSLTPLQLSWIYAERYAYPGSIGLFFSAAFCLYFIYKKNGYKEIVYIFCSILIVALCVRTIIRNNDWKNMENFTQSTISTSPLDPKTQFSAGLVYMKKNDFANAEKSLLTAIKIKPDYADAYQNLGSVYFSTGKYDLAEKYTLQAIKLDPNNTDLYINLGILYESTKQFSKAEQAFKIVIQKQPNKPDGYSYLAELYFKTNNFDAAKQTINQELTITPNDSNLYTNLGVIALEQKNTTEAKEYFNRALQINPKDTTARDYLLKISQ